MLWPVTPPRRVIRFRRKPAAPSVDVVADDNDIAALDARAIRRARDGDLAGFNEVVDRHQAAVFNVVLRTVRDASLAEDITQETFLRAWRAVPRFRGGSVKGWLMRIAINRSYDALRSRKRRPTDSLDALEHEPLPVWASRGDRSEEPEAFSLRVELSEGIEHLLARLPEEQRTALLLVDLNGFSYDEAAAIMNVAPGTIKSRISRARSRLRDDIMADDRTAELFARYRRHSGEAS